MHESHQKARRVDRIYHMYMRGACGTGTRGKSKEEQDEKIHVTALMACLYLSLETVTGSDRDDLIRTRMNNRIHQRGTRKSYRSIWEPTLKPISLSSCRFKMFLPSKTKAGLFMVS